METSAVNLREYSRIYTGTNQETGYENPFFGYTADTIELIFKEDKITYFHYPITAPNSLLIDSSLVKDGAIAGENPYCSDKIWKKQANYSSNSIWGNSQPVGKQTGVWLCSWLSGNAIDTTVAPVWKDRWYNPGYIDPQTALFTTNPITTSIMVDIDSQMSFEGGCYYKYFHVGNTQNDTIVNNLTAGNHLKLYLEDWSENPTDLSNNNNTSKIQHFTDECVNYEGINYLERPLDSCLNLYNTNYCETLYSNAIELTGNLSYNIWAKSADWTKGNNTILSKDNRGGYALRIDQGFDTPFMTFFEDTGKMVIMNTEGQVINSKSLPEPSKPTSMLIDSNHFTWVADNSAKKVYQIDYNGDILNSIDFDYNVNIFDIKLDKNENLYVLTNQGLSAFNNLNHIADREVLNPLIYTPFNNSVVNQSNKIPTAPITITPHDITYVTNRHNIEKGAVKFNSDIDNYVEYDTTSNIFNHTPLLSAVSYTYWIKLEDLNQRQIYATIYDYGGNGYNPFDDQHNRGGLYFLTTGNLEIQRYTYPENPIPPSILTIISNKNDFNTNDWYNITETYDLNNGVANLYINSQLDTTSTMFYGNSGKLQDRYIWLGRNKGTYWDKFNGQIDDFMIFDKILTTSEISAIYTDQYILSASNPNKIAVNLENIVLEYTNINGVSINNYNQSVTLSSNSVYVDKTLVLDTLSACVVNVDKDNNIWVLYGTNSYLKMDGLTSDYITGTIGTNSTPTDRCIDFTYELKDNIWTSFAYFTYGNQQKIYKTDMNGTFIKSIDISFFDTYPMLNTFTAYDWYRKFNFLKYDKIPQLKADIFVTNGSIVEKNTVSTPTYTFNDANWHMFTYTFDKNNLNLYIDSILRDTYSIGNDTSIYYTYENSLMLGTDVGKNEPLEKELLMVPNYFKGKIDALRIYDSILNNFDIRHLYLSKYDFDDLIWNIPTGTQNYIEEIVRFFKFKLPGQKSQYYNINLIGLQITDENTRIIMENIIRDTIKKVAPAYAELYKIVWK